MGENIENFLKAKKILVGFFKIGHFFPEQFNWCMIPPPIFPAGERASHTSQQGEKRRLLVLLAAGLQPPLPFLAGGKGGKGGLEASGARRTPWG